MALGTPTSPFPAIAVTTQSITSAPFTPVAGALVIVQTTSTGSAAATGSGSITCTIPGMDAANWQNVQWNPATAAKEGGSLYWCLAPANPTQGTVTVTLSAVPNEVRMASIQIPGAATVVGAVATGLDATGTINLTLGATPTAADCVVVGCGSRNGWHTAPFPASAGFTKIAESYGSANPESSLMLQYAMGYSSSSVTVSGLYTADNEAMGLIVKPASGGGGSATTASPSGIGTAAAFGAVALAATLAVSPVGITSNAGLGTPTAATSLTAAPAGIGSASAVGTPSAAATLTASPSGIGSPAAMGTPSALTAGSSSPTGIQSMEGFGSPTITLAVSVSPEGIASALVVGSPTVTATTITSPDGIPSAEAVGVPSATITDGPPPPGARDLQLLSTTVPVLAWAAGGPVSGWTAAPPATDDLPTTTPASAWATSTPEH